MSEVQWFYARDDQRCGPISARELKAMAAAGQLLPKDLVWRDGMSQWIEAGRVKGLFLSAVAAPPLPQPVAVAPLAAAPVATASAPSGEAAQWQPPIQPLQYASPMPSRDIGQDATMRMLLPVGRSGWAIAAGYLGLLSPLPIFGPFAVICSILAFRDMKRHPDRHGMGRAIFGVIMGALFTLFWGGGLIVALMSSAHGRR